MTKLKRESACDRAYLAAYTVAGLMQDFLWTDESPLCNDYDAREDALQEVMELVRFNTDKYKTQAEFSEALQEAAKAVKSGINSKQAEAWLDLCVDMACKCLSSAQRGDEAVTRSAANDCIGTCIEALRTLNVRDENLCESLGF